MISELVNNPDTIAAIAEQRKDRVAPDSDEEVGATVEICDNGDTVLRKDTMVRYQEEEPFFMRHIKQHGIEGCKDQQEEFKQFINEDDKEKLMYKRKEEMDLEAKRQALRERAAAEDSGSSSDWGNENNSSNSVKIIPTQAPKFGVQKISL